MVGFDPEEVSYGDLLEHFFKAHDYTSRRKPQYASKVFPVTAGQEEEARRALKSRQDAATTVQELETFWVAEDYHQKYRLRQFNQLMALFSDHSPEQFINSPLAAKLNAISAGKNIEVDSLELPEEHRETVEKHVQSYV
jgi:peptide methionine sulfoxide reductase MsrA